MPLSQTFALAEQRDQRNVFIPAESDLSESLVFSRLSKPSAAGKLYRSIRYSPEASCGPGRYSVVQEGLTLIHNRSLLTKEWYKVPFSADCPGCGAQTRSAAIVVGPSSLVGEGGSVPESELLAKPRKPLRVYAFVEALGGQTEHVERSVVNRFHSTFAFLDGQLTSICEHCAENLPPAAIRSAVMNVFVRLGRKRLLVNERLMLFASDVVLTEFRGETSIEESAMRDPDYALLLVCDTESAIGETGMIELWHSIARDDYAMVIKGHDGREMLRDAFNSDLKDVVRTISDLGLVLTQLHIAQTSSPYCALARDLFLEALEHSGYRQAS